MGCLTFIFGIILLCSGCESCSNGEDKFGLLLCGVGFLLIYFGSKDD